MLEFKLQYYFEEYKDSSVTSYTKFREEFKKKHNDFELFKELYIMIQKYQLKKYGTLLGTGKYTDRNVKKGTYKKLEWARTYSRFGTKAERNARKVRDKYSD